MPRTNRNANRRIRRTEKRAERRNVNRYAECSYDWHVRDEHDVRPSRIRRRDVRTLRADS